jgi:hypothetical protein
MDAGKGKTARFPQIRQGREHGGRIRPARNGGKQKAPRF